MYDTVPKEREANLQWRRETYALAAKNKSLREGLKELCKQDMLYWLNGFCGIFEPRTRTEHPFITRGYQDEGLGQVDGWLGSKDVVGEKSRDMGLTWTILALFVWHWQFHPLYTFGVASRTEDLVLKDDPDSLFWKIDFLISKQPAWLVPSFERQKRHFTNKVLGCTIKGYSTTDDIARGGRQYAIFLDEFAAYKLTDGYGVLKATQYATNSRVMVSTPEGAYGAFYDMRQKADAGSEKVKLIRWHWTLDPVKAEGQYVDDKGKVRSPYYDGELERAANPKQVAEQLDIDYRGAGDPFFDHAALDRIEKEGCRMPTRRGRLIYDEDSLEPTRWEDDPKGPVKLWCPLAADGRPAYDEYGAGADISAGSGVTPSVLEIGSKISGEKVLEYAHAERKPDEFACDCIALCRFFHNAQLCWEAPGPGSTFTRTVVERGYRSLFYRRRNEDSLVPLPGDQLGWFPNIAAKRALFESFRSALGREWGERSIETIKDCRNYRHAENGDVTCVLIRTSDDDSGAAMNHGDRAVASALCWLVIKTARRLQGRSQGKPIDRPSVAPPGSIQYLIDQEKRELADKELYGGLKL